MTACRRDGVSSVARSESAWLVNRCPRSGSRRFPARPRSHAIGLPPHVDGRRRPPRRPGPRGVAVGSPRRRAARGCPGRPSVHRKRGGPSRYRDRTRFPWSASIAPTSHAASVVSTMSGTAAGMISSITPGWDPAGSAARVYSSSAVSSPAVSPRSCVSMSLQAHLRAERRCQLVVVGRTADVAHERQVVDGPGLVGGQADDAGETCRDEAGREAALEG